VTVPVPLAVVLPSPPPPPPPPPAALPLVVGSGVRGCALPTEVGVPVEGLASLDGVHPARQLVMVAAASEACVIARSDGNTVELSVDDGRSFVTVLGAPGPVGALVALSDGTVLAVREQLLGAALPDGTTAWRRLPARGGVLRSSGMWIALAVDGLLALSDDRGATWRWRHLPVGTPGESLRLHVAGGAVRVAARGALFVEEAGGWRPLWTAPEAVVSWAFGEGGWLYAFLGDDHERVQLVAVSPGGRARPLTQRTVPDVTIWPHEVASNGDAAVANVADTMARLHRGRIVDTTCAGEACQPDLEQSPWRVNRLLGVDRHGLPLVEQRSFDGHLVRLAPAGPRALL
jgi:hypothetical protein